MNEQDSKQKSFEQLEQMLTRIESGGLRSLNADDVLEFGHLYRQTVSTLSTARSQGVHDAYIEYLNQLASRAYGHIYISESKGWPSAKNFFSTEFPQSFRRNLPFILVSFLAFMIAAMFAFSVIMDDPGKAEVVFGPGISHSIDSIADRHTGGKDWMPGEERPIMSSFVLTNNLRVAALAFSVGVLGCVFTLAVLFYNGLFLGVIGAAISLRESEVVLGFWSFVAPHGVIELTAIFISGGAGLMLGWALLSPGDYTRGTALKLAGWEAFKLILGVAAMLIVAGIIEGFFSPSMLPNSLKLAVAGMLAIALFCYLFLAGRERSTHGN